MTDYISISHWGLFPAPKPVPTPNLESQFINGWEAAFGLHLIEERN